MQSRNGYEVVDIIYSRGILQAEKYMHRHSRVLSVLSGLNYPLDYPTENTQTNCHISECVRKVMQNLKRQGDDPESFWVREQNVNNKHPHYHLLLLVNGNKRCSPEYIYDVIESLWNSTINADIPIDRTNYRYEGSPWKNGTLFKSGAQVPDNLESQISYMSKPRGKGDYNDGLPSSWREERKI